MGTENGHEREGSIGSVGESGGAGGEDVQRREVEECPQAEEDGGRTDEPEGGETQEEDQDEIRDPGQAPVDLSQVDWEKQPEGTYDLGVMFMCPACSSPVGLPIPDLVGAALNGHGIRIVSTCCQVPISLKASEDHKKRIGQGGQRIQVVPGTNARNLRRLAKKAKKVHGHLVDPFGRTLKGN